MTDREDAIRLAKMVEAIHTASVNGELAAMTLNMNDFEYLIAIVRAEERERICNNTKLNLSDRQREVIRKGEGE